MTEEQKQALLKVLESLWANGSSVNMAPANAINALRETLGMPTVEYNLMDINRKR